MNQLKGRGSLVGKRRASAHLVRSLVAVACAVAAVPAEAGPNPAAGFPAYNPTIKAQLIDPALAFGVKAGWVLPEMKAALDRPEERGTALGSEGRKAVLFAILTQSAAVVDRMRQDGATEEAVTRFETQRAALLQTVGEDTLDRLKSIPEADAKRCIQNATNRDPGACATYRDTLTKIAPLPFLLGSQETECTHDGSACVCVAKRYFPFVSTADLAELCMVTQPRTVGASDSARNRALGAIAVAAEVKATRDGSVAKPLVGLAAWRCFGTSFVFLNRDRVGLKALAQPTLSCTEYGVTVEFKLQ